MPREVAEEEPDFGAEHFLVERAEHLPRDRAVRGISQEVQSFQRREHALETIDVGIDPVHPVERERALRRVREDVPRVVAHDWHAARDERAVLRVELAPLGHGESLIAVHRHRDVPRGAPVDERWCLGGPDTRRLLQALSDPGSGGGGNEHASRQETAVGTATGAICKFNRGSDGHDGPFRDQVRWRMARQHGRRIEHAGHQCSAGKTRATRFRFPARWCCAMAQTS